MIENFQSFINENKRSDFIKKFDPDIAINIFKQLIRHEPKPTGGDCWTIGIINFLELKKTYPDVYMVGVDGPHVLVGVPLDGDECLVDGTGVYDYYDFRVRATYKTIKGYLRALKGGSLWVGDDQIKDIETILKHYKITY